MRVALLVLLAPAAFAQQCGSDPAAPFCTSTEECCMDSPGCSGACTECCVKQSTKCVAPRPPFQTSTCCARWTVGCTAGSVGCCDPARPWQNIGVSTQTVSLRKPNAVAREAAAAAASTSLVEEPARPATRASSVVAHALFTKSVSNGLTALTIDVASGNVTSKADVTGPASDYYDLYYGESTRVWPFDAAKARFVFADFDFSESNVSEALKVYTIDAKTGASTKATVTGGCGGYYPLGMAWDATKGTLAIGAIYANPGPNYLVFHCTVDVDTGVGTSYPMFNQGNESSPTYYASYLSHVDNGTAYRVGHLKVSTGETPGYAAHAHGVAPAKWERISTFPGYGEVPATVTAYPPHPGSLLSLFPRSDGSGALDLLAWLPGGGARLLAKLNNSHMPTMPFGSGVLGYVGGAAVGSTYAAMTVATHPNPILPGAFDKWSLSVFDLETETVTLEAPLSPQPSALGAETTSLSGFGLAGVAA